MNVNNLLEKGVKLHNGWYYYAGEYLFKYYQKMILEYILE